MLTLAEFQSWVIQYEQCVKRRAAARNKSAGDYYNKWVLIIIYSSGIYRVELLLKTATLISQYV